MSELLAECIVAKLDKGMTVAEACETYGLSPALVGGAYFSVRGKGPENVGRRTVFTPEVIDMASAMWACGATMAEIAEALGVKKHTVDRHMSRHRDRYPRRVNKGD